MNSENSSHFSQSDRERIIRMDEKVVRLINDVQDLKDNFAGRIETLETIKLDKLEAEKAYTALRAEILEHASNIESKLIVKYTAIENTVLELKDGNKWIIRLIIGAVILSGLGLLLVKT